MPFKPGHKKIGGRSKGTPNKSSQSVQEICDKYDYNPIESLIHIAVTCRNTDHYLSLKAAAELAQYLVPKRKAIEHSVDPRTIEAIDTVNALSKDDQIKLLEAEIERLKDAK